MAKVAGFTPEEHKQLKAALELLRTHGIVVRKSWRRLYREWRGTAARI